MKSRGDKAFSKRVRDLLNSDCPIFGGKTLTEILDRHLRLKEADRIAESRRTQRSTPPQPSETDTCPRVIEGAKATRLDSSQKSKQVTSPTTVQPASDFFGFGSSADIAQRIVTDEVVASLFSLIDEQYIQDNAAAAAQRTIR